MSDDPANYVSMALQVFQFAGCVMAAAGGVVMFMARKTFATIEAVDARFVAHNLEHQKIDKRFNEGDSRLVAMTASIEAVGLAANQATAAAHSARESSERLLNLNTDIAKLHGDIKALDATIKPIERLTMDMVEGHMTGGLGGRSAQR